jgi:hypothetical protein
MPAVSAAFSCANPCAGHAGFGLSYIENCSEGAMSEIKAGHFYWLDLQQPRKVQALRRLIRWPNLWACKDLESGEVIIIKAAELFDDAFDQTSANRPSD